MPGEPRVLEFAARAEADRIAALAARDRRRIQREVMDLCELQIVAALRELDKALTSIRLARDPSSWSL